MAIVFVDEHITVWISLFKFCLLIFSLNIFIRSNFIPLTEFYSVETWKLSGRNVGLLALNLMMNFCLLVRSCEGSRTYTGLRDQTFHSCHFIIAHPAPRRRRRRP